MKNSKFLVFLLLSCLFGISSPLFSQNYYLDIGDESGSIHAIPDPDNCPSCDLPGGGTGTSSRCYQCLNNFNFSWNRCTRLRDEGNHSALVNAASCYIGCAVDELSFCIPLCGINYFASQLSINIQYDRCTDSGLLNYDYCLLNCIP